MILLLFVLMASQASCWLWIVTIRCTTALLMGLNTSRYSKSSSFCCTQIDCCPRQSCIPQFFLSPINDRKVIRFGTTDRNAFRGWSPMGSCTICLTISAAAHCWCCRSGSRMSSPMPAHVLPHVQPYFMCSWLSSLHGALNHVLCAMAVCPSCASHSWSRLVQVILLGYEWMVLEIINNCVKSFVLSSLACCMHRDTIIIV
jgi:hypothetical protein